MTAHTALVTGGSRGIGRAVVDRLRSAGARVLTCGRGARPADLPADVEWVSADLARTADVTALVAAANHAFGPISLLVNNAGIQVEKTTADSTDKDWAQVIDLNCRAVFATCRAVLPEMAEHGGVIINIGSISGVVADPSMALYNASKAFVHGLTRSIAIDHGPAVRCNAIQPGWIATAMSEDAFALARDPAAAREDALARHPAGRFGAPEDIAGAVAWLASPDARHITGQCLTIDGGLTAASPLNPGLF
ncbi:MULTISPECIES: SDR family NAD(P)-dependent oxidoreductase [unclassified Saccharopolyspora]|uniref:SDR family NAD(P)-dependent oxidoreductase n=1 Tax=unclassified Saccharopolyspora TaxID=2646250 RepID=UPI001CD259DB|nr:MULTISPECIES: SDR family oxidoreductase [unclassified Saccharopolyspora]MCA1186199.1 SDR family oxidoreductase [Saccharopolyspora sp. 6T]MCA1278402.1 SDR family oxidoreductase [Saccharopolyspora sp. 7B]